MGAGVVKKQGGGGRGRRRGRVQPMSEINVTPFVDVMLVLLIIFMVAAPLLTVGVPVELPKTAAGALPADQEEPLTVTITAEGAITFYSFVGQIDYKLHDIGRDTVVTTGSVDNFTGYSATGDTVETLAAQRDARERLMVILADQVVRDLYVQLDLPE